MRKDLFSSLSKKNLDIKKLSKTRYLYYVSKEHFMLFDTDNNHKYISKDIIFTKLMDLIIHIILFIIIEIKFIIMN